MSAVTPMRDPMEGLVALIEACHCVTTPGEFALTVYPMLGALLPHEMFAAALVEPGDRRIDYCLNMHFPDGYLQRIISPGGTLQCPVFSAWRKTSRPVCFDVSAAGADALDADWLRLASSHGIRSIAAHGLPSRQGTHVSFFMFAGIEQPRQVCQLRLRLIVPALHAAIGSVAPGPIEFDTAQADAVAGIAAPAASSSHMSNRELEVLRWISRGKSTDEAATILGISPWTVKAHVKHILVKLEVTGRTQAVAKAFQLGLIT